MGREYNPNDFTMIDALSYYYGLSYIEVHARWKAGEFTEDDFERAYTYYDEYMDFYEDERGYTKSENELFYEYLDIAKQIGSNGLTFRHYIEECCDKNGTLTKV